ncbi:MAG: hypothetical protein CW742_06320 [Methanoregula sp.]|nr:MAG: hypothetical protein CW742_06320 [Methanoregula sp.]
MGLSEVVGFVLIIALLMAVFSLYLTYGVPAQGRENEILHMNTVKDQFINYKIGLDALANNNKVGTTVSNSFTLGSEAAYTEGVMAFIPIMKPVNSGGVFSINRRTNEPETLTISSRSLVADPLNATARTAENLPATVNYTPGHVFVTVSGIQSSDLSASSRFGGTVNTTSWTVYVNLTPQSTLYQNYKSIATGSANPCEVSPQIPNPTQNGTPIEFRDATNTRACLVPMNAYAYNGTDLSLTVKKKGIVTMENYPVYRNIQAGTPYIIDLMDPAYGLSSSIAPSEYISIRNDLPLGSIAVTGNITYNFIETTYQISPITLGAVDYRSQNNYWISQEYYYQMGGVFLSQIDGNNTYKLPPAITFSMDNSNPSRPVTLVTVNAMSITNPYGGSVVGGNSPVQVKTTLDSLYTFPYADGIANTKWIRIGVDTPDDQARAMWKNYFDYTSRVAGLPDETETGIAGTESYIIIHGTDAADTGDYDIKVVATNATYAALLYGVGG